MRDLEPFAAWLKRRRKALDLTRAALAQRAHCSASAVWRLEAGDLRPSKSLAESLAAALGIPAEELEEFVRFARGEGDQYPETSRQYPGVFLIPSSIKTNLPAPLTSFVGRKREVTAVCELLRQEGVRLLTLTGPPGVGKTRLSLAVANRLADTAVFPDGVYFVSLAPLSEPALVVVAVAQTFVVRETQEQGTLHEGVKSFLRPKRLLLVLDNFEQVTSAAPLLTDWLTAAPGMKAVVTSREILHAYGEHEFPVPPLDIPDVNRLPSPKALSFYTHYAAVQLFKERARATQHDFRLTADNVTDIARICAWLDGLPLAIEMAAAQVKWQTVDRLYEQLHHRLAALTGGPHDLSPRQQSLRGAIEWSYHLLHPEQQRLFEVCAVFVGGFGEEAVGKVSDEYIVKSATEGGLVEEGLRALIEKSLLHYEIVSGGEVRYGMLESLREYAQEQLDASGKREAVRQAHAAYYAGLAQTAEQHFVAGGAQAAWLKRLEQEHNNLRAAMVWGTETVARAQFALEFARAMYHFWYIRGYLGEGRRWLEAALTLDETASMLRGHVLNNAGNLARLQGDYNHARALLEQASVIQAGLGDEPGLCQTLENLAVLAGSQGDYARASELLETALGARRQLGDASAMLPALNNLAIVAGRLKDSNRAEQLYRECAELSRVTGNVKSLAHALQGLGNVRAGLGDHAAALVPLRESLLIRQELNDRPALARCLGLIGITLYHLGDVIGAARLISASVKLEEELGIALTPATHVEVEAGIALVRARAGEEAFARAWAEGQSMPLEEVLVLAGKSEGREIGLP